MSDATMADDGMTSCAANADALAAQARNLADEERHADAADAWDEAAEAARYLSGDDRVRVVEAFVGKARALQRTFDADGALEAAETALAESQLLSLSACTRIAATLAEAHALRGEALLVLESFEKAVEAFDDAIAVHREAAGRRRPPETLFAIAALDGRRARAFAELGEERKSLAAHAKQIATLQRLIARGNLTARIEIAQALCDRAISLETLGDDAAAKKTIEAALEAAEAVAATGFEGLESAIVVLERAGTFQLRTGDPDAASTFTELVDIHREFFRCDLDYDRTNLVSFARDHVRDLADAGHVDVAAQIIQTVLEYAAPDGRGAAREFAAFLHTCRQLSRSQLRAICTALPQNGATLRMLLGK